MSERVAHFEITADEPDRAASFYRDTFGWTVDKWEGPAEYWLIGSGEGKGIDGAIMPRAHGQAVINTVQLESTVEDALARITKAGGAAMGDIVVIPGVGRFSYATDTEGNVFGVMEPEALEYRSGTSDAGENWSPAQPSAG